MEPGDIIEKGSVLMTVEGMKMEVSQLQLAVSFLQLVMEAYLSPSFSLLPSPHSHPLPPPLTPIPTPQSYKTHILAVKDGKVKTVFYAPKDNVPAFSRVIEFEED